MIGPDLGEIAASGEGPRDEWGLRGPRWAIGVDGRCWYADWADQAPRKPGAPERDMQETTPDGLRGWARYHPSVNEPVHAALTLDPSAIRVQGEYWTEGWDIPTRWAVSTDGRCWMDSAHGGDLRMVPARTLLDDAYDAGQDEAIRQALGRKPSLPSWIRAALAHGWTPPGEFDREAYDVDSP